MIRRLIILLLIVGLNADSIPIKIDNRGSNWWTEKAFIINSKDLLKFYNNLNKNITQIKK